MEKTGVSVVVLLLALLLAACAPQQAVSGPAPAPRAPAPAPAPSAAPVVPAWQVNWEKTLQAAKQEGTVAVVMGGGSTAIRIPYAEAFKKAYGITIETVGARSAEISAKIITERRAGLYFWDVNVGGTRTPLVSLKPAGALDPLEQALILPDVTDPELIKKVWYQGKLWWVDRDRTELCTLMFPFPPLAINTNLVKPEEIKSYNDFLDPKWKGKLSFNDPTVAGSTFSTFMVYLYGPDWLRKLARNEPVIMRDERLQMDWLSHGKTAVALGPQVVWYLQFKNVGAPIQIVTPQEGTWLSVGSGALNLYNRQPHPNAARVFINWTLSKEGQTVFSRLSGGQSAREDVPTDSIPPESVRQPGVKYWEVEQEDIRVNKMTEAINIAREIFAPSAK